MRGSSATKAPAVPVPPPMTAASWRWRRALQPQVERRAQRQAGPRGARDALGLRAAGRVDGDALHARRRRAGSGRRSARCRPGRRPCPALHAAVGVGAELVRVDLAGRPDELRGGRAERVAAQVDLLDGDAREVALVLEQVVAHRLRRRRPSRGRSRTAARRAAGSPVADAARGHAEDLRERGVARGELGRGGLGDRHGRAAAALRPVRARRHLLTPGRGGVALGLRAGGAGRAGRRSRRGSRRSRARRGRGCCRAAPRRRRCARGCPARPGGSGRPSAPAGTTGAGRRSRTARSAMPPRIATRSASCGLTGGVRGPDWPAGSSISASRPRERRQAAGRVGAAAAAARVLGQRRAAASGARARGRGSPAARRGRRSRRARQTISMSSGTSRPSRNCMSEKPSWATSVAAAPTAIGTAAPCGSRSSRSRPAP